MINFNRLEVQLMQDEGFSPHPYLDTVGVPTIGYGTTRIHGRAVQLEDPAITAGQARDLLRADIYGALIDAQYLFRRLEEMPDRVQEAVVNMAYNLGVKRLGAFRRFLAAAQQLDYATMAVEAIDSKWYGQVGQRATRIVAAIKSGILQ